MSSEGVVRFPQGKIIFVKGDVGREMYVIQNGEVEVSINGVPIAVLGPRESIGEMSLLLDEPRSATVKALTPVEAVAVTRENFRKFLSGHPDMAWVIMRSLAHRLNRTTADVVRMTKAARGSLNPKR